MPELTIETLMLLSVAGVIAGAVNAIAGGGTFFTFPVLVWAGLPPLIANTTNMVALLPANGTALPPLRAQLAALGGRIVAPTIAGVAGATIGAILLLVLGDEIFANAVPYLIGFATALFATAPTLRRWLVSQGARGEGSRLMSLSVVFLFAVYGGYFGAGIGQIMLAALILAGFEDLKEANALKNVVVLAITIVAVLVFAWSGTVAWPFALVMAVSSAIGGYLGGILSVRASQSVLRAGIISFGCFLTVYFLIFGA